MPSASARKWRKNLFRHEAHASFTAWLKDRSSLTARLQAHGTFTLRLLRQEKGRPTADEAAVLGIPRRHSAWIREVALCCNGVPLVFAHTVLPLCPRGSLSRWLAGLGSRSLGAALLAQHRFTRNAIVCKSLDQRHPLFRPALDALQISAPSPRTLAARRSGFSLGRQTLLVTEIFSPRMPRT